MYFAEGEEKPTMGPDTMSPGLDGTFKIVILGPSSFEIFQFYQ